MSWYFADLSGAELAQILGVVVVLLGGFYGFSYKQMKEARTERKEERIAFTDALKEHADAQVTVAVALDKNTKKSDESIKVSKELSTFMKRLNGTLPRSIEEKQAIKAKEE